MRFISEFKRYRSSSMARRGWGLCLLVALFANLTAFAQGQQPGNQQQNLPWHGAPFGQQPQGHWQGRRQQQQKMEFTPEHFIKEMTNFITNEAKLTQEEADKFFPMLFEMQGKTQKMQQKRRELSMKARTQKDMTEQQYACLVMEICKSEVEEKQVEETYYQKFHSVLSWEKIYKVRVAINAFHMRAIGMFSRGRGAMPQGPWQRGWQPGGPQNK